MNLDYQTMFLDSFAQGIGLLATSFGSAFAENPWPCIGVTALLVASAAIPTRRVRRRRRV